MRKPIVSDPEIISGTPVFLGTRIPLDHVVGLIRKGVPDSELAEALADGVGGNAEDAGDGEKRAEYAEDSQGHGGHAGSEQDRIQFAEPGLDEDGQAGVEVVHGLADGGRQL